MTRHRSICALSAVTAALSLLVLAAAAVAYPRPSAVPIRWELKFEPGDLRLFVNDNDGRVFWYFTYKVTNLTDREQTWAPEFTLYTDDGRIMVSGRDVPGEVTQELLDLLANPHLRQQNELIGEIRQGPLNALEGLVIWPAQDMVVTEVAMFVAGISGDTASIRLPDGTTAVLRKTLHRQYIAPGNILAHTRSPMELVHQQWIFR
jgi:hypothetical protein